LDFVPPTLPRCPSKAAFGQLRLRRRHAIVSRRHRPSRQLTSRFHLKRTLRLYWPPTAATSSATNPSPFFMCLQISGGQSFVPTLSASRERFRPSLFFLFLSPLYSPHRSSAYGDGGSLGHSRFCFPTFQPTHAALQLLPPARMCRFVNTVFSDPIPPRLSLPPAPINTTQKMADLFN